MKIDFVEENKIEDLGIRVRAIMGVPEEMLTDDVISSPTFLIKAEKYINNNIKDVEETEDNPIDKNLLNIAYLYYICYLLCPGMYSRLPKQMENKSTKTILQSTDWDKKALEFLDLANATLEDALEDYEEDNTFGDTFAVLSDESEYPNTTI